MMLPRRGFLIWSFTTPSITLSPKPWVRLFSKAASRSGPWVPFVPACWSVWQLPQVAWPMNSVLPFTRSADLSVPLPQPASASAARALTAAAHRDVLWSFLTKAGRRLSARAAGRPRHEDPRRRPDRRVRRPAAEARRAGPPRQRSLPAQHPPSRTAPAPPRTAPPAPGRAARAPSRARQTASTRSPPPPRERARTTAAAAPPPPPPPAADGSPRRAPNATPTAAAPRTRPPPPPPSRTPLERCSARPAPGTTATVRAGRRARAGP